MKRSIRWIEMVKRTVCPGCRSNRYNMGKGFVERAGIDAPVTCDHCWSIPDSVRYDRSKRKWVCGAYSRY